MIKKIPRFKPSLSWETINIVLKKMCLSPLARDKGKEYRKFEEKFADYIGSKNAIAVPSGRVGLYLILKNLGLRENAEVILPSFTYWVIPRVISFLNLQPVFVDIDLQTCNLDVSLIEKGITADTKIILPTHLYGLPCEMDTIVKIARRYNLLVIEDCVQSCGAEYKGKKVGSIGGAAYFGFGITKGFSFLGGGMVTTNNDKLAQKIREDAADYDFLNKQEILKKVLEAILMKIFTSSFIFSISLFHLIYFFSQIGIDIIHNIFLEKETSYISFSKDVLKFIPFAIQNKVCLRELARLDSLNNKRIKNAAYLLNHLKEFKGVIFPPISDEVKNIFANFPIRTQNRNLLAKELLKKGIDTSKGYIKAYGDNCPKAKALEKKILHIPVYPSLKESDLLYVSWTFKEIFRKINL